MTSKGRSARQKGHGYERELVKRFISVGFKNCVTARAQNRFKDSQGIDLINTGPFDVQCKNYSKFKNPLKDFDKMPDNESRIKTLAMKCTHQGEFVTVKTEDFFAMISSIDYNTLRKKLLEK